jgi:hypothetical protein
MNGWPFCILQILLVIPWREDGRLTIVNWRHCFIRFHSYDRENIFPLTRLRILPRRPQTRHAKRLSISDGELKFRFLTFLSFLPLEKTVGRHNATAKRKGLLLEVHVLNALGACVEEELAIVSLKAPPHERNLPLTFAVHSDDRLRGTGRNVIFGPEVEFFRFGTRRKQFCDPLFVGTSSVSATHI